MILNTRSVALAAVLMFSVHSAFAGPAEDARAFMAQGQYVQALQQLDQHLAKNPQDAEARFMRFFHNTPMAIATVDKTGRVARENPRFARTFGPQIKDDRSILSVVAERHRAALAQAIRRAAERQSDIAPVQAELVGVHDGARVAQRGALDRVLGRKARAHQQFTRPTHRRCVSQLRTDHRGVVDERGSVIPVSRGEFRQ